MTLRSLGRIACLGLGLGIAGLAQAQSLSPGPGGFGNAIPSSSGIQPLGPSEAQVLESVRVGVPVLPGVLSVDQVYSFDRNSPDATINNSGIAISLPYVDLNIGQSGNISVAGRVPTQADLPNYLLPALLPPGLSRLVLPLHIGGGATPGPGSVPLNRVGQ